jgi:hypothetical protein
MSTESAVLEPLELEVCDQTEQKVARVRSVDPEVTIDELIAGARQNLELPSQTSAGETLSYHARLEREGRHLLGSEKVGQALRPNDRLVLHHNVDAGRSW